MTVVYDMVQVPHFLAHDLFNAKASDNTCGVFATFSKIEREAGAKDEFPTAQYIHDKMVNLYPHLYAVNMEKTPFDVLNALYFAAATVAGYKCARLTARMDDHRAARIAIDSVSDALAIVCKRRLIKGHNRPRDGWNEILLGPWKSYLMDAKNEVMYDWVHGMPLFDDEPPPERWCLRMDSRLEGICKAVESWPMRY